MDQEIYFQTPNGELFTLIDGTLFDLNNSGIEKYLIYQGLKSKNKITSAKAKETVEEMKAKACYEGKKENIHCRVAKSDNLTEIDLCNTEKQSITIENGQWEIKNKPKHLFRRPNGLLPLPTPSKSVGTETGERLFKKYFNFTEDSDLYLMITFLVYSMHLCEGYPIAILKGGMGTGKSTMTSMIKMLTDPEEATRSAPSKNEQDLCLSCLNRHVVSFDNLSFIKNDISDAFCRISTGGAFRNRKLYSNQEENIINVCKPVILNGISDLAKKSDLISRSIVFELLPIKNRTSKFTGETELWKQFKKDCPLLLGHILNGLSYALHNYNNLDARSINYRFKDFCKFGLALEKHYNWPEGSFNKAMQLNQNKAILDNINSEPVSMALWRYISSEQKGKKEFQITPTDLYNACLMYPEAAMNNWPKNGQAISSIIDNLATDLESIGINFIGRDRTSTKRYLRFEILDNFQNIEANTSDTSDTSDTNITPQEKTKNPNIFDE